MTDTAAHEVSPSDEIRHPSDAEPLWNESYYMDLVTDDGSVGAYIRLGFYPNLGVAWWTTAVVEDEGPSIVSAAYDLAAPAPDALRAHGEGVEVEIGIDDPLACLSVLASARGGRFVDPTDVYRGLPGEPVELTMDLRWRTDGAPYHYDVTTRYEIPCLVEGLLTIDDRQIEVRGQGQRDHSWGVRDWWAFGWCWMAGRLDDGTRVHAADIRIPGMPIALGYVQEAGSVAPIEALEVTETLGAEGLPTVGQASIEPGGLELTIEPLGFGPLVLTSTDGRVSRFPRAMVRLRAADGREGLGWIEWNQPQGS